MELIKTWLLPLVVLAGFTSNTITVPAPIETAQISIPTPIVEPSPNFSPNPVVVEEKPIECSCVKYAQSLEPSLPLFDAIDYPVNTINPKVGDIIKLQYYNATTTRYTYHIARIKEVAEGGYTIQEANYEKCKKGERFIAKDDENIVGFFDMKLWLEIKTLPLDMYKTLQCESNFSHYKQGAVKRGKDGEWGLAQFMKSTWNWATDLRRRNKEKEILLDIYSPYDQIKQMKYLWDKGYSYHWYGLTSSCFEKLGNNPIGWTPDIGSSPN